MCQPTGRINGVFFDEFENYETELLDNSRMGVADIVGGAFLRASSNVLT